MGCAESKHIATNNPPLEKSDIMDQAQVKQMIFSSTDELTVIVEQLMSRWEAKPLGQDQSELLGLGLAFGRASATFKAVQGLISTIVTRLGARLASTTTASDEHILLYTAFWNNCVAKATMVSLHPALQRFLDLKVVFAASSWTTAERIRDAEDTEQLLVPASEEIVLLDAMIRLSVHYYQLHDEPAYKAIMLRATRSALGLTVAPSLAFRVGLVSLVVHLEWEEDSGMAPDIFESLLTSSYLPPWMHSYIVLQPFTPRFIAEFRAAHDESGYDQYTREVLGVRWNVA